MGHFVILGAEDALMSDQLSLCPNLTTSQQGTLLSLAAKDTPRTDPTMSDEMVPCVVAEDGIALGVYGRLAGGPGVIIPQPEKHLWTAAAFYSVLVRVQPEGVRKYSTPSANTPSGSVSTAP